VKDHYGAISLAVIVAAVAIFVYNRWHAVDQQLHASCTVGVTGHAAMVNVVGQGASESCASLVGESSGAMYLYDGPIAVPVVCQETVAGDQVTVYDDGTLDLYGQDMCHNLLQGRLTYYAAPTPTPLVVATPTPVPDTPTAIPLPTLTPTQELVQDSATTCWVESGWHLFVSISGTDPQSICSNLTSGSLWGAVPSGYQPSQAEGLVCQHQVGGYQYAVYDAGAQVDGGFTCQRLNGGETLRP